MASLNTYQIPHFVEGLFQDLREDSISGSKYPGPGQATRPYELMKEQFMRVYG